MPKERELIFTRHYQPDEAAMLDALKFAYLACRKIELRKSSEAAGQQAKADVPMPSNA